MNGLIQYLEQDLQQAEQHLAAFKANLKAHVEADFVAIEADLRALVAHGEEKVAAIKTHLAVLTTAA